MEWIKDINHSFFLDTSKYPVFFSKDYANFLENTNQNLIIGYSKEYQAYLPFRIWSSKLLCHITCLYPPLTNGELLSITTEKSFLNAFVKQIKEDNLADRITSPDNFSLFQTCPDSSVDAAFGSYRVDLSSKDFLQVFSSFQARYRSAINSAKKERIQIKYGEEYLDDFYALHRITMNRSSMHVKDKSYFEKYFKYIPNNTHLAVGYHGSEAIGALLNIYNAHSSYYLYGCSSDNTHTSGAIKYLHSDAMEKMIQRGVTFYDFVGARLSDVSGTKLQGRKNLETRY
jgi:hypothetical protein